MENNYSVLMSVYDREQPAYLRQSIESILAQTLPPKDFVIVCDGPLRQELQAVLTEFQNARPDLFQIIPIESCGGLGNALNLGMRYCRFEWIARMDSDDISLPTRCERQLHALQTHHAEVGSGTVCEFEGTPKHLLARRELPESAEQIRRCAGRRNPFNHPCVMYKKSAVLAAGGYRHCPFFEDYDLWARMLLNGSRGYNLPEPLLYMRAGEAMYARRGGISYAGRALRFRFGLWKSGLSTLPDFLIAGLGQTLVCLLPNRLRQRFYRKILRKEAA